MDIQSVEEIANSATTLYQNGKHLEAADLFSQAAEAYQTIENNLMATEMMNNQSVALLIGKEYQKALDACLDTAIIFLANDDERRAGVAYANEAAAYEALGKLTEAEKKYLLAAELLKKVGEKDMYAQIFQSLSQLQLRTGRQYQALSSMKINLDNTEKKTFKQKILNFVLKIQKILLP